MRYSEHTDEELLSELGSRLRRYRLNRNRTQSELAHRAGLSMRTIRNAEKGVDPRLSTVIRILRALDLLDSLDAFLPASTVSPMELLRTGGRERQRASGHRDG